MIWLIGLLPVVALLIRALFDHKEYLVPNHGIVLITGSSSGIGHHAVEHLAAKYKDLVIFAGVRKEKDVNDWNSLNYSNVVPILVDVSSSNSCALAFSVINEYSKSSNLPFVGLINNAGIGRNIPAEYHPLSDVRSVFETNVFGVMHLVQLFLPLLRESKGRIIMLSSIAGFLSAPLRSMYASSKFAIEGFADGLRRELDEFGISVSLIEPGLVKSAIFQTSIDASNDAIGDHMDVMKSIYSHLYQNSVRDVKLQQISKASDPSVTSEAIEHALMAKFPKSRYVVANINGVPGYFFHWMCWLLPDRIEDWVLKKISKG